VVTIRNGTPADVDAVLAVWCATAEPSATDDADSVTSLMTCDRGAMIVAVDEGAVIGTVIVGWDGWRGAMYRLAVVPRYRHRGIATRLVREGERRLRTQGARRLHMIVAADATAAQSLWSTAGYEPTDQLRYVKNLGCGTSARSSGSVRTSSPQNTMNRDRQSHQEHLADADVSTQLHALERTVRTGTVVGTILERVPALSLPDWYLGAGAITHTVWNDLHGYAPSHGIRDYDIVYFDAGDLTSDGEARVAQVVGALFADLGIRVDVKNEARVNFWYERRFGTRIEPYRSSADAISTWPTTATSVGVRIEDDTMTVCAPFGLRDLFAMVVRPNKTRITRDIYEEKVQRWRTAWPRLTVVDWDA